MQVTEQKYYTPEEYLQLEETAECKSEYISGQIIPMAGGSINHNRIARNLVTELNTAFKQQDDYEAFIGDVRLWMPKRQIYTYPDIMIVVGEPEYYNRRSDTILNPQVIIEILSNSTKGYDREDKFEAYRTISTFQEYLLVDQTRIHVERFSKTGKKQWSMLEYDAEDEAIKLTSVPFQISLVDLYNKVEFDDVEDEKNSADSSDLAN